MLYVYLDYPDHPKLPAVFRKVSTLPLAQAIASQHELLHLQPSAFARALGDLATVARQANTQALKRIAVGYIVDAETWDRKIVRWTATNGHALRRVDYRLSDDGDAGADAVSYMQIASYYYDDLLQLSRIIAQSADVSVRLSDDLLVARGKHKSGRRWMANVTADSERVPPKLATFLPLSSAESYKRVELRGDQLAEMVSRQQKLTKEYKGSQSIERLMRNEIVIDADTPTSIRYRMLPYDPYWTYIDVLRADDIDPLSINSRYLPSPVSDHVTLLVPPARIDVNSVAKYVADAVHISWADGDAQHHHVVMPLRPLAS